jgi:hypothetical protein
MAYAPCGFILGVVIQWCSLIKAVWITRRYVIDTFNIYYEA